MLERTLVFVDTSYLLASFYNSWDTGARAQLEIDLPEVVSVLGRMTTEQLKQPIHRQYWYDGIPDSGPHRYQRALRNEPGVQLRAGQLIEWGDRRTQKAVDTRLVADMVVAAYQRAVSDIVLVSGDADMLPGVEEAVNAGIRVHLYGFGWDSMSSALRFACDSTTILDPREDFRDTMRLQVLEGPMPPTVSTSADVERPIADAEEPEQLGLTPVPLKETAVGASTTDASQPTPSNSEAPAEEQTQPGCRVTPGTELTNSANSADTPHAAHVAAPRTAEADSTRGTGTSAPHQAAPAQPAAPSPANLAGSIARSAPADSRASDVPATASPQNSTATPSPHAAPKPGQGHNEVASKKNKEDNASPRPNPGMMARHRKLRSQYVPLPDEVWSSAGEQNPFDIGQQYAVWWYDNVASEERKDSAHLLTGGGLPPEIDRPLLQFACETLHEYTLTEVQRVGLRDGFHAGIRGIMLRPR